MLDVLFKFLFEPFGRVLPVVFDIKGRRSAVYDMVRRERAAKRREALFVRGKREDIVMRGEFDAGLGTVRVKHPQLRREPQSHIAVIRDLTAVRQRLRRRAQLHHHLGHKGVDALLRVGGEEHAVIAEEQKIRVLAGFLPIFRHFFPAHRGENIARLRRGNPNGVRKQLRHEIFSVLSAGHAVDERGMHMKHQLLREQVVQKRFHARTLPLLARKARRHHRGKHLGLPCFFVGGKGHAPNFGELCPVHSHKTLRRDGGEFRARALDI